MAQASTATDAHCPRCGGELIFFLDGKTGDSWAACIDIAECAYWRPVDG